MTRRSLGLMALGLAGYYLAVLWFSGFFRDPHYFLFQLANDSIDYVSVSDWIYHGTPSEFVARRSFGYPLFLGLARLGGDTGVWIAQGALWVATAILFYLCLFEAGVGAGADAIVRRGVMAVYLLVWSPILLTGFALTETLARFLFALMAYFLLRKPTRWGAVLITAGCLAVVKPNYAPLFLVLLALLSWAQRLGRLGLSAKRFAGFAGIALIPLAVQVGLVRIAGPQQNSSISSYVLQQYFHPQVLAKVTGRDIVEVKEESARFERPPAEILQFFADHPGATVSSIFKNLEENIRSVMFLDRDFHPIENFWRKSLLNSAFYWLHILMLVPVGICLWRTRGWRQTEDLVVWTLALVFFLGMLPTGITYWAGDRLTSPLLPIWPLLYLMVIARWRRPS